ncbi:MAG: SDR family NAD(P)-dependent oxidoreductase [Bacteroidia bacterium]
MNIQNKVIVVTGAGSGMGREMTLQLVKKGAKVAMVDIHEQALAETASLAGEANLSQHTVNIAHREEVEALPEAVISHHGAVDGIINNAGIIQPFIDVNDLDYDKIERIMNINFYGTLYMTKAFLPHLLKRPEAHIANVSSMGGFIPFLRAKLYAPKAAVKLLRFVSELKRSNVHVTVIHPGAENTNIMRQTPVSRQKPRKLHQRKIRPVWHFLLKKPQRS